MLPDLAPVRECLRDARIGAWLVWDFRGSNPIFERLLPPPPGRSHRHVTRRAALWIPVDGEPLLLTHQLDRPAFADVAITRDAYSDWRGLRDWIESRAAAAPHGRLAMEYSPGNALPVVACVDAGTIELVRAAGVEVVSSADLVQVALATWSADAVAAHADAARTTEAAKDAAFDLVRARLAAGAAVTECEVQALIMERFRAAGLEWADDPIVAVNAHAADPHYAPTPATDTPIRRGDWLLIDLWARHPGNAHVYSDITWVATCAAAPDEKHLRAFEAVRAARDAPLVRLLDAWQAGVPCAGWELDAIAAAELRARGYADAILHRTGHSLSPGAHVHGLGVNLDDRETHDTRAVLPGLGFTIEPGVYLAGDFGVRLEINVHVDPHAGPTITSCVQDEIVVLG